METEEAQEGYKDRMPNSESKFAFNKYDLNYRQYHVIGQNNALTQQLLMAIAQNMLKIHNIEQQEIEKQKTEKQEIEKQKQTQTRITESNTTLMAIA